MPHHYHRRVTFSETDAAGVLHFSRLLCYVEEAEHDFLQRLKIPILEKGGWPRVRITCDYLAPLRFGDAVEVLISPKKIGSSSVVWQFSITNTETSSLAAEGEMTCVRVDAQGKPINLPETWITKLSST